jgi:hypothetical protein
VGALASGNPVAAPASEPAPRAAAGPVPVITNVSPDTASAGTGTTVTITGTGFGTRPSRDSYTDVGFVYRYDGSTVTPIWASGYPTIVSYINNIISWSDTEIIVQVPAGYTPDGYGGSASSGYLWVLNAENTASAPHSFAVQFGYGELKWAQSPVPYSINPDGMSPAMVTAIQTASELWNSAVSDAAFRYEFAGTTTATSIDGNLIRMGSTADFPSGELGIAYVNSGSSLLDNHSYCTILFNPGYNWTAGTSCPGQVLIQPIALHELGHWLTLKDLYGSIEGYPLRCGKGDVRVRWPKEI